MYFKFASRPQEDISVGQEMGSKGSCSYTNGLLVERFYLLKYGFLNVLLIYCMDIFQLNFDLNPEVQEV